MNFFLSSRWSVRLALIIIALLALIALTSQWWLPYDPQAIDLPSRLLSPDAQHWLGTDHLGRDIFSRLMAATRVSLGSVMACLLLVLTLGLVIGGSAGLIGGRVDPLAAGAGNAGYRPYDAARRGDVLPRPRRDRADRRMGRDD